MKSDYIDKRTALIISLQVLLLGFKNCLITGIPFLFLINDSLNRVIAFFVGILYVYAFWLTRSRHLSLQCQLFWIFIVFSYIVTLLFFPQNTPFILLTFLKTLTILFMTSILLSKIKDYTWLEHYMTLFAYPIIVAGGIAGFFLTTIGHATTAKYEGDTYVMSLSYAELIAVMWLLHEYFKKKKLIALLFALVGVVIILLYGSRNPLLAIVTYVFIELIDATEHNKNISSRVFYRLCLVFFAVIAVFYKQTIIFLLDLSNSMGFGSRSLQLLSADEVDLSNRDTIHDQLWGLINANPVTGLGIQGDMAQMNEMAHSLYLSILSTYGYIVGFVFIVYLVGICITALKYAKGIDHQILVIYLCLVFPRSFTGGDMWGSDIFWWLMAFVFVSLSKSKKYRSVKVRNHN